MSANEEPDWARPVVHWDLQARDPEAQRAFYGAMFNWDVGDGPIHGIPAGIGGPEGGPEGHIIANERIGFAIYVQVRDIRASMARCTELGGVVEGDVFHIPNGPSIAPISDPEGNRLVLVQQ